MGTFQLIGYMNVKPECKESSNGYKYCSFQVKVPNMYVSDDKENQFSIMTCLSWGNIAEEIAKKYNQDEKIQIIGHLSSSSRKSDSKTYFNNDLVVDKIAPLNI